MHIILGIIVFALPFFIGCIFHAKSVVYTYFSGQLLMWAVFQIVAVPAISFKLPFSVLFWLYTGIIILLILFAAKSWKKPDFKKPEISFFLLIAICIIAGQCCIYIYGTHIDQDDARWIAEANDALIKNKMLLYNPATGEYIGRFIGEMAKDVFSPWSMYLAWLSRATGIRPAVIAHTIYAPILLLLSYCVYYEIGRVLFEGKKERGIFLLMVSVINLFMAGNVYTQSVFSLTRIWQGKAVVAAVIIPAIFLCTIKLCSDNKQDASELGDTVKNWMNLIIMGVACCLFSGMGIVIGVLMIAVFGIYMIIVRVMKGEFIGNRIAFWLLSMAPGVIYGLSYFRLKG